MMSAREHLAILSIDGNKRQHTVVAAAAAAAVAVAADRRLSTERLTATTSAVFMQANLLAHVRALAKVGAYAFNMRARANIRSICGSARVCVSASASAGAPERNKRLQAAAAALATSISRCSSRDGGGGGGERDGWQVIAVAGDEIRAHTLEVGRQATRRAEPSRVCARTDTYRHFWPSKISGRARQILQGASARQPSDRRQAAAAWAKTTTMGVMKWQF